MQKVQLIDKSSKAQLSEKKRQSSLRWAAVNLCFLSVIFYDVMRSAKVYRESETIYYVEVIACGILSLSLFTNVIQFIYHSWFTDKIICENEAQRILLNLSNNSVVRSPAPKTQKPAANPNETINIRNLSYQNYSEPNSPMTSHLNHNSSWMSNVSGHLSNSTFAINPDGTYAEVNSFQTPPKFKNADFIMNRSAMDQYLNDVSQNEKDVASAINAQNNMTGYLGTNFNSFWGNRFDQIITSLKTSLYQLSPHTNKQNPLDETYSKKDQENNSEIIRTMCANKLSNYTANLKMWISKTILEPLVAAINDVDKAFQQRGFTDMKIGNVGLERLKKISSTNQHLIQHIPMLPKVIPYLELTSNQEYLVQRIRELAKGSCMKNYKFKSVSFNQPDQNNDQLPSDAAIIFHVFCTYLDSQLHPLPDIPRAFYSRYVILGDVKKSNVEHILKEVGKNKAKCGILCSNPVTPKFNFVSDKVHTSSYDRNNLFYVIIQFLIHLKAERTLESVNLGKSGINILNIIED